MKALGAYLRELRKGQRMTQTHVAELTGINASTLHRIEKGETEPGGENALNLVAVVRGSYEDARRLWSDRNANEDEGRKAAEQRLAQFIEYTARDVANGFTSDEIAGVRRELARDPDFLDTIAREILRRAR